MRLSLVVVLLLAAAGIWAAGSAPAYPEIAALARRTDLSVAARVKGLTAYLDQADTRLLALEALCGLDQTAAQAQAGRLFRAKGATDDTRLALGHFLLAECRDHGFAAEFGRYLVPAVLAGEKTFLQVQEEGTRTAVGEYAFLAAGFMGYDKADFDAMADARTIPVLIYCLAAPDEVYAKDQGDFIRGKPGTSTGRNLARQNIPLALARLHAVAAIPALQAVVKSHHDANLRANAATALAALTAPTTQPATH